MAPRKSAAALVQEGKLKSGKEGKFNAGVYVTDLAASDVRKWRWHRLGIVSKSAGRGK